MLYSDPVINQYMQHNYSPEVIEDIISIFDLLMFFNKNMHELRDELYQYILDVDRLDNSTIRFMFSNVITEQCTDIINMHGIYLTDEVSDSTVYKVVLNTLRMLQSTEDFYALSSILENSLISKKERFVEIVSYYNNIDINTFENNIERIAELFFTNINTYIAALESNNPVNDENINNLNKIRKVMVNFAAYIKKKHSMFVPLGFTLLEDSFPINRGYDYYLKVTNISYLSDLGKTELATAYNAYSLALMNIANYENLIKAIDNMTNFISEDSSFNYRVTQHAREIELEFNNYVKGLKNEKT